MAATSRTITIAGFRQAGASDYPFSDTDIDVDIDSDSDCDADTDSDCDTDSITDSDADKARLHALFAAADAGVAWVAAGMDRRVVVACVAAGMVADTSHIGLMCPYGFESALEAKARRVSVSLAALVTNATGGAETLDAGPTLSSLLPAPSSRSPSIAAPAHTLPITAAIAVAPTSIHSSPLAA